MSDLMKGPNISPLHEGIDLQEQPQAFARGSARRIFRGRRAQAAPEAAATLRAEGALGWPFGELSASAIARCMHVSVLTARRWRRTRELPYAARLLGHLLMTGDLGAIDGDWNGWLLHKGHLYAPSPERPFLPNEIAHYSVMAQRVAALEATVRRLEREKRDYLEHRDTSSQRRELLRTLGFSEALMRLAVSAMRDIEQPGSPCGEASTEARALAASAAALVFKLYQQREPELPPEAPPGEVPSA